MDWTGDIAYNPYLKLIRLWLIGNFDLNVAFTGVWQLLVAGRPMKTYNFKKCQKTGWTISFWTRITGYISIESLKIHPFLFNWLDINSNDLTLNRKMKKKHKIYEQIIFLALNYLMRHRYLILWLKNKSTYFLFVGIFGKIKGKFTDH